MGGPFVFSGGFLGGISCVGLTEGAYESIGKSIVPGQVELLLLPLTQFNLTAPVHEMSMKAGDKLEMPIYGAVKPAGESLYFDNVNYTITMETDRGLSAETAVKEGRAKFEARSKSEFQKLTFEPIEAEVGRTLVFRFKLNAPGVGEVEELFFVSVTNKPASTLFVRQDPPVIFVRTSSGNLDPARLTIPPSGTEARVTGPNSSIIRLFWSPPPPQLQVNQPFDWTINVDNGTAPAEQRTSTTTPPLLRGQIGDLPPGTLLEPAAAGYELVFFSVGLRTYRLVQRSLTRSASITEGGLFVPINVKLSQDPSLLEGGEVTATITWFYKPAP